jgi:hypothetical protein
MTTGATREQHFEMLAFKKKTFSKIVRYSILAKTKLIL